MSPENTTLATPVDHNLWQPCLAPGLTCQEADDELIVLDRVNQRVHQLNRVGASALKYCDGNHTMHDIVNHLLQEFDVGRDTLSKDIANLLQKLKALKLLK